MLNYRYNWFLILRTIVGTLAHTDWQIAYARGGIGGVVAALGKGVVGIDAWPFFVDAHAGWTRDNIRARLQARGIASWGWGYAGGEFFFRVRFRQAHWAQHVLLEQGVPLRGRLLDDTPRVAAPRANRQDVAWAKHANRA